MFAPEPLRRRLICLARLLLVLACAWWLALPALAQRQVLPMSTAASLSSEIGTERLDRAELAVTRWTRAQLDQWWQALDAAEGRGQVLPKRLLPPDAAVAWAPVNLPDVRRRPDAEASSPWALEMRWYHLRYEPQDSSWPGQVALYLPRLRALPVSVLVRHDSGWLPVFDNRKNAREQWVRPIEVALPAFLADQMRREGRLDLMLAVPALVEEPFMVPGVRVGPRAEIDRVYRARWSMQIVIPQAAGMLLAVICLFSFTVWLRHRQDPTYLLCGLLALFSILRNLQYYIDLPEDPVSFLWFWWGTHASMSWVLLISFLLALSFVQRRYPVFERLVIGVVLGCMLLTLPLWSPGFNTVLVQQLVNAAIALCGTVFIVVEAWRSGHHDLRLVAFGMTIAVSLGLHDLALLAGLAWHEHPSILPYAPLAIAASFVSAIRHRFVQALHQVERANAELSQRLIEQSTQLQAQHEQLTEAERQQALLIERQRLMHDMHDGLGSSLLSAMVAVEQGRMQQDEVVGVLRECVDDLRLVIDSLEPVGHDLVSLLATMRYRLGKRLQAGGLSLEWDVQDLPPLDWLEPPDALHVLRLLQEALNNVLKHAHATRVRIATRHAGDRVEIRVEDDGQGFDISSAQKGRGLRSQVKRAERLGGTLHLETRPGQGTRLSLRLPVNRKAGAAASPACEQIRG